MPASASFERGKAIYANMCSQCHGMAGDGRGPDGLYLKPRPANLQDQAEDLDSPAALEQHSLPSASRIPPCRRPGVAVHFIDQRWDLVRFIVDGFQKGRPVTASVKGNGDVPDNYVTWDDGIFQDEGGTLSPANGKTQYTAFCAGCHGANGQGSGPAVVEERERRAGGLPCGHGAGVHLLAHRAGRTRVDDAGVLAARVPVTGHDDRRVGGSKSLTETDLRDITAYVGKLASGQAH